MSRFQVASCDSLDWPLFSSYRYSPNFKLLNLIMKTVLDLLLPFLFPTLQQQQPLPEDNLELELERVGLLLCLMFPEQQQLVLVSFISSQTGDLNWSD